MPFGRKLFILLALLALIGVPALIARTVCLGHSCETPTTATSDTPFCSLPVETRTRITNGFREGRSPEVLAVTASSTQVRGKARDSGEEPIWPSLGSHFGARVPIVFSGDGVNGGAHIPGGTTLDAIAPTESAILEFERPFPKVRSGKAIDGVADGNTPALLLNVILKGIGSVDLEANAEAWPVLERLMNDGTATMDGDVGSLPLDDAATMSTIGTGGLPRQHGITGALLRNDGGELVEAFGRGSPVPVIAALGDDLDDKLDQRPLIGLSGSETSDRGAIGGNWYINGDEDEVAISDDPAEAALEMLARGFGADDVSDVMVVALEGDIAELDRSLGQIVERAEEVSGGSVAVSVTATGSDRSTDSEPIPARRVVGDLERALGIDEPVIEAPAAGGLFLDGDAIARLRLPEERILTSMQQLPGPTDQHLFSDAFPAIAVSFSRYC
jgi:hypothetical protein